MRSSTTASAASRSRSRSARSATRRSSSTAAWTARCSSSGRPAISAPPTSSCTTARTESWWQQFGGMALVGEDTGKRLERLPARIVSWREFRREHPAGLVLSRETGYERSYGQNPYGGYDDVDTPPFFATANSEDARLPVKERVVFVERGEEAARALLRPAGAQGAPGRGRRAPAGGAVVSRASPPPWTTGTSRAAATSAPPRYSRTEGSSPSTSPSGLRLPPSGRTCGSSARTRARRTRRRSPRRGGARPAPPAACGVRS
jgi:hypothetical protein